MTAGESSSARYSLQRESDTLTVGLHDAWALSAGLARPGPVIEALEASPRPRRLAFRAEGLASWDSSLVAFVHAVAGEARRRGLEVDTSALPEGAGKLLGLARAVPPEAAPPSAEDDSLLSRVGRVALAASATAGDALAFVGEMTLAFLAFLRGRARYRRVDLLHALEASGVAALGIVALINFLIGAVLAFVGAVQLAQFGATIYVADLVAVGITRELGALMTGIVMSGRTGASFAAVLGTMTVNEEVDALRTMGLRPVEFLVVPRVLATALMMPALVAYADLLGLLGGAFVAVVGLDLGTLQYLQQTRDALALRHVLIGLAKSVAFGAIVATSGCYYGIHCGRSAAAVGEATTRAVVTGILLVVVADAVFTVVCHVLQL
ncbi:MAG TPA: ABC transporter permease [Vicinamibacteria bacterium]|nr:ABC transporter permease [Vicinamibacteria bacterium]